MFITAKVAFIFKEDIADYGSMQDACHMNFVIDLVHRGSVVEHRSTESEGRGV